MAKAAATKAEVAAVKEEAQWTSNRGSMSETHLKMKDKGTEHVVRDHKLRRMMMLVRKLSPELSIE